MFKYLNIAREIKKLVDIGNSAIRTHGGTEMTGEKYLSFFLTNRSFLVPVFGVLINILVILNLPILAPLVGMLDGVAAEAVAEGFILIVSAVTLVWSVVERFFARDTQVVFTRKQAEKVVINVVGEDRLSVALRQAVK